MFTLRGAGLVNCLPIKHCEVQRQSEELGIDANGDSGNDANGATPQPYSMSTSRVIEEQQQRSEVPLLYSTYLPR